MYNNNGYGGYQPQPQPPNTGYNNGYQQQQQPFYGGYPQQQQQGYGGYQQNPNKPPAVLRVSVGTPKPSKYGNGAYQTISFFDNNAPSKTPSICKITVSVNQYGGVSYLDLEKFGAFLNELNRYYQYLTQVGNLPQQQQQNVPSVSNNAGYNVNRQAPMQAPPQQLSNATGGYVPQQQPSVNFNDDEDYL